MNIEIVKRSEIGKDRWDAFVEKSDECWLWHQYNFQDALSKWRDFSDISFSLVDKDTKNTLIAIMPLHLILKDSILSLGGLACINNLSKKEKEKIYSFTEANLINIGKHHSVPKINISLASMTPAYSGERCPRVNPLIELGCENTLTQTWIVDLRKGKEDIWNNMEGRARTAVRKAIKNNVSVRKAIPNQKDLDTYYKLHTETYNRTGVPPHSMEYFEFIWNYFLPSGLSYIVFAEYNGEVIAAENFGVYKKRALYWTGAASVKGLDLEANSLLQWNAMQWMVDHKIEWYETGEAFPHIKEGKVKGLNDFKKSFGGELYPFYKGCFNIVDDISINNGLSNDSNKKIIKEWLRSTKKILIPLVGRGAVNTIGKIVYFLYNNILRFKKILICKYKKRIFFIEPFWSKDEINIGLGEYKFEKETSQSRFIETFKTELNLKDYIIVPTSSGRVAIELSLKILKSKYPDKKKVILPSYGCKGTYDPIINNNLVPIFVDINKDLLLDIEKTIKLFSDDILACLIVNLTGNEIEMLAIIKKAKEYNIFTIVDNCQNTRRLNDSEDAIFNGDIAVYSFGIGKNAMATGGGAAVSRIYQDEFNDELLTLKDCDIEDAKKRFRYFYLKYYKHKNVDIDYSIITNGLFNYNKMNPVDCEILHYQLKKIDKIIQFRKKNAKSIIDALKSFPNLFCYQFNENHIFTKLSIKMVNQSIRNDFSQFLDSYNIETENMYIPLHQRDFAIKYNQNDLKLTEMIAPCILNIPVRPNLKRKEIKRIVKAINKFGKKYENEAY